MVKSLLFFIGGLFYLGQLPAQSPYFQQEVNYEIHVRLDDKNHFLHARMDLDYKNNSPDTLAELYFHLWPNAFSSNESAFARQKRDQGSLRFYNAPDSSRGYIDSLNFRINGEPVWQQNVDDQPDIILLRLGRPLHPGESLTLSTPFRVKIPNSYSRLGHIGQQYQITQWYPKPAVYDLNGWHPMPYLDQGEFYSEFGSFDVYIDLPEHYMVGATGDLPDGDPEHARIAAREALTREQLIPLVGENDTESTSPVKEFLKANPSRRRKILHYHQEKVHDFAWFADQNYYVLADTVETPSAGKSVRCVALFTDKDRELWLKCPEYVAQSVYDYSKWVGDYPYAHATAVDGALSAGAGMEYPNVTVLGTGGSASSLEQVTMHEVGHNWFYGMLGSNERSYPWMDEGMNSFIEHRYWRKHHPGKTGGIELPDGLLGFESSPQGQSRLLNKFSAFEGNDQPIQFHAADYTSINYGLVVYMETALSMEYLEQYLGEETMDKCLRTYFDRWKFKHPQPEDMQAVFEEVSGQDLGWFFGDFIQTTPQLNFGISKNKGNELTVTNKSGIVAPAQVELLDKEGNVISTHWTKPFEGKTTLNIPTTEYQRAYVHGDDFTPDWRPGNNYRRNKGLLRLARPLALNPGLSLGDEKKFNLNFMPVLGGNTTDGFLLGALFHHGNFPRQPFNFHLMPMYGFRSNALSGSAGVNFRWLPSRGFRKIELKAVTSSFSNFVRAKQSLIFYPWRDQLNDPTRHRIALESHFTGQKIIQNGEADLFASTLSRPWYGRILWNVDRPGALSTFNSEVEAGYIQGIGARLSGSLGIERKLGKAQKMLVRGRVFGGLIASGDGITVPTRLGYGSNGSGDPFGEQILFDRADNGGFLGRQVQTDHGGLSTRNRSQFNRSLLAFNGTFRTPYKVEIFADAAYGQFRGIFNDDDFGQYVIGLRLPIMQNAIRINFPLIYGDTFTDPRFPDSFSAFGQGINFTFEPLILIRGLVGNNIDIR